MSREDPDMHHLPFVGIIACTVRHGTRWLANIFRKAYSDLQAVHEPHWDDAWTRPEPAILVGHGTAEILEKDTRMEEVPVVHITRDPVQWAESVFQRYGWVDDVWERYMRQHKGIIANSTGKPYRQYRVEWFWENPDRVEEIAEWFGLEPNEALYYWAHHKIGVGESKEKTVPDTLLSPPPDVRSLAREFGYEY